MSKKGKLKKFRDRYDEYRERDKERTRKLKKARNKKMEIIQKEFEEEDD